MRHVMMLTSLVVLSTCLFASLANGQGNRFRSPPTFTGGAYSYSSTLRLGLVHNGEGLRLDESPRQNTFAYRLGLERGDVLVTANQQRLLHSSDLDQVFQNARGTVHLTIRDVNTGRIIQRTVRMAQRPNSDSPQANRQATIYVRNELLRNITVEVTNSRGFRETRTVAPNRNVSILMKPGSTAVVRANFATFPLNQFRHGTQYTISRNGNQIGMRTSWTSNPPFVDSEPNETVQDPAPPVTNQVNQYETLSRVLQISTSPLNNGNPSHAFVNFVRTGGLGDQIGLRSGDTIVAMSAVGIPLQAGRPAQPGMILKTLQVQRNGQNVPINVAAMGTVIIR